MMSASEPAKSGMSLVKWCIIVIGFLLIVRAVTMAIVPLTDPSESRYGNICRNMALSDNFVEPMLIHKGEMTTFDGKPPLYFQIGGIACRIFGINEFAVRLPALLCGILTLLIVFGTVKRLAGSDTAVRTVVLLATAPFFCAFCGICITDMTLVLCVTGALCSYMLFTSVGLERPEKRLSGTRSGAVLRLAAAFPEKKFYSVCFFFFLGLGMLAKGPVALVLSGMPVFFYILFAKKWKELKDHAWITGFLVFFAVAAPWYWIMQSRDPEFLKYFFINENFKRFLIKNYGDKFGAGREYFRGMALIWSALANISMIVFLLWPLLKKDLRGKLFSRQDFTGGNALLAIPVLTVGSITLFWCLTSRVPVYYILPTVPAAAIATAVLLTRTGFFESEKRKRIFRVVSVVLGLSASIAIAAYYQVQLHTGIKFPQQAYAKALQTLKTDPACRGAAVYIARRTPYSAEFYLGGENLVLHKAEDVWKSLKESENSILIISDYEIDKLLEGYLPEKGSRHCKPRRLVGRFHAWRVYAPAEDRSGAEGNGVTP